MLNVVFKSTPLVTSPLCWTLKTHERGSEKSKSMTMVSAASDDWIKRQPQRNRLHSYRRWGAGRCLVLLASCELRRKKLGPGPFRKNCGQEARLEGKVTQREGSSMGCTTESQGLTRGIVIPISRGMSRTLKGEGGQRPYGPLGNELTINEGPWHRQLRKTCPTLFYRPSLLAFSKPWRTKKYIKWGGVGRKKERR